MVGTEQGHPLSPEFFKIYIHELSVILDNVSGDHPLLWNKKVNHLLWADDLVAMSLNSDDLNALLKSINDFCTAWGLEVNIDKTKVMIFNSTGRHLKSSTTFKMGETIIDTTKSYTYLGITFTLSGSFMIAREELRKKALRSYFSLKRTLDVNSLSVKAVLKLFDSLILPILSYGIQVWFSTTHVAAILKGKSSFSIKKLSLDSMEKLHMEIIKWTLGVHKRASNIGCYGETGRAPLGVTCLPQILRYFMNLERLVTFNNNISDQDVDLPLVYRAFMEQKILQLEWYDTLKGICNRHLPASYSGSLTNAEVATTSCYKEFSAFWMTEKASQNRLSFLNSIKVELRYEEYLSQLPRSMRSHVTRLRIGAHLLNSERGRYNTKTGNERMLHKVCESCMDGNHTNTLLHELPFYDPIIEDESHVLVTCPRYHLLRSKLPDNVLSPMLRHDFQEALEDKRYSFYVGQFIKNIFQSRNPKSKKKQS